MSDDKNENVVSLLAPELESFLESCPEPTAELERSDRREYNRVVDARLHARTALVFMGAGVDQDVYNLAIRFERDPQLLHRVTALRQHPVFQELQSQLATIRREEIDRHPRTFLCNGCGEHQPIPGELTTRFLCAACEGARRLAPSRPPANGLRSALFRARRAHLPATLTQDEWQRTIEHFNDRCAFCSGPWCLVEHATPIALGGGTTAANCLPACVSCNVSKGPREIEDLTRNDHIDRAIWWLRSCGR